MSALAQRLKELLGGGEEKQQQQGPKAPPQIEAAKRGAQDPNNPAGAAKSPEQIYAEVWGQEPAASPGSRPLFNTDPAKFGEAVNGMDFTKNVPKELMEKVLAGDAQALMSLVNRVGQNAFSTATMSSKEMIEHANRASGGNVQNLVNEAVRAALAQQNINSRNPAFSDPLVAPLLGELSSRIRAKFPEASAEELSTKADEMLMMIAKKLVSGSPEERQRQKQQQEVKKSENFDWESWATTQPAGQENNQQTDFAAVFGNGGNSGGNSAV